VYREIQFLATSRMLAASEALYVLIVLLSVCG